MIGPRIFRFVLDQLYPRFCVGCAKEGEDACLSCLAGLKLDAQWQNFDGLHVWSPYDYRASGIDRYIQAWKYQGSQTFAKNWFALLTWPALEADLIVPIPLHKRRQLERGFNQAEEFALFLGARASIPAIDALQRIRYTKPQAQCDAAERRVNMTGAFTADPSSVAGKRILLVDDVVTTGSTLLASREALLKAGANDVVAVCLARGG